MDAHRRNLPRRPRAAGSPSRQGGGTMLTMLLLLGGLLAMLGLVEIGYLYWVKRDAQKVADLAALAGAQRLDACSADNADNLAARDNAERDNGFPGALEIRCGHWSAQREAGSRFVPGGGEDGINAVEVVASRGAVPFFGGVEALPVVRAQAIAVRAAPTAAFSVGAQLARLNGDTPLGSVLRLVGADLDGTTLLGYDGLAQVRITPEGLLRELGVPIAADIGLGELEQLLAGRRISLADLLDASARLLTQQQVAGIDLEALRGALASSLDLEALAIQLGSDAAGSGLFARIVAPDGLAQSALRTEINLLDVLTTGIGIASKGRAVAVDGLELLGLVQVQAGIVEPPSLAIGGVGTRAYNAQVRLYADIDTDNVPILSGALRLLGIRLHLPVHVDVTNAMGTLSSLQCDAAPQTATVRVESTVLRACVGRVADAARFSTLDVCGASLQNEVLLRLLGANVVDDRIALNALSGADELVLAAGETGSTRINGLAIGDALDDLVGELLRVLSNMLNPARSGAGTVAANLARRYAEAAPRNGGRYDADSIIALARDGSPELGIEPIGDWTVRDGVPRACVLGLGTCWRDGSVWEGYRAAVTGEGLGVLDGLLGTLLGGLVINRCDSLFGNILGYNECVTGNLASYLQTAPDGVLDAHAGVGSILDPGTDTVACSGLMCIVLGPPLQVLKPLLNGVGDLLSRILAQQLGIELGRTDVHVQSIQCSPAQLVH